MKFYVVWNGRKPGIYTSWEECKEQVHGFSGASFKSFADYESAIAAFKADNTTQQNEHHECNAPNAQLTPDELDEPPF